MSYSSPKSKDRVYWILNKHKVNSFKKYANSKYYVDKPSL